MTNIKDRIIQIADNKNIKRDDFFKNINVSYSNYRGRSKKSAPNTDVIVEISSKHPEINLDWLLTGKGNMFKENQPDIVNEDAEFYTSLEKKGVPYYDIDFTASFLEVENTQQSNPDSYISHPFFRDCDMVVRASGQSMAKLIKHGDAIGLSKIEDWHNFILMGEVYAIVTRNNFRTIKIITKGENENYYTLISKPTDSKKDEFPPQQIKKNQILHIFKVKASATLF